MTPERWLLFFVTELLICLTPGPAVLFVLAQGLRCGPRSSMCASAGILAANSFYFLLSATSVGALIAASARLFLIVKWLGVAYLFYRGFASLFGKGETLAVAPAQVASGRRTLISGWMLEMANPKCLLFFMVILPQFVDPRGNIAWQIAIYGVTSVVTEFFVLAAYGVFAGRFHRFATRPTYTRVADRLAGSFLILAGILTASARRA